METAVARWRLGIERQFNDLVEIPRPVAGDLLGGISVALVLIPQSLAYAALAGLPPAVGLFASAFPLLIFAVFASSPFLQTGPVALTSLLVAGSLAGAGLEPETEAYIGAAAILALIVAAVRLFVGILRLGSVVYLMAEPVAIGFTSAAGIVILASQLPRALGSVLPAEIAARGNPIGRGVWVLTNPGSWTLGAIVIFIVTVVLMHGGRRLHRLFPGVLVAVIFALSFSRLTNYQAPVLRDIEPGLPQFSLNLPWSSTGSLIVGGIVIALVGFAEPASIARMFANEDQTRWSSSREFFASGLANAVAGVTGAYPVGGSFSRSFVNRFAGAQTRLSGAITGLVVVAFLPFAGLLDGLPEAALGSIVVGAVASIVKPRRLLRIARRSPWQASLTLITFVATLVTPPNIQFGVIIGVAATIIFHFARPFHIERSETADGGLSLRPRGLLWIGTNARLKSELGQIISDDTGTGPIVIDLERSVAIDAAIADAIAGGRVAAERSNRTLQVAHAPEGATPILEKFDLEVV